MQQLELFPATVPTELLPLLRELMFFRIPANRSLLAGEAAYLNPARNFFANACLDNPTIYVLTTQHNGYATLLHNLQTKGTFL